MKTLFQVTISIFLVLLGSSCANRPYQSRVPSTVCLLDEPVGENQSPYYTKADCIQKNRQFFHRI